MGEKSIVILGHANHSSEVIISIHIEQVLYDENLKSYFPKISKKFKCQDLIRLQRIRAFIWITCLHGFLPSESAPNSQQHTHGTHQVAGCPLLSLPTTTCLLTRNPRSSTPHHHFLQALPSSCWHFPGHTQLAPLLTYTECDSTKGVAGGRGIWTKMFLLACLMISFNLTLYISGIVLPLQMKMDAQR